MKNEVKYFNRLIDKELEKWMNSDVHQPILLRGARQREAKNARAEVDFVIQKDLEIVPVEVKSGKQGKMQSLHLFMKEKESKMGIRTSLENFAVFDKIRITPLYAIGNEIV